MISIQGVVKKYHWGKKGSNSLVAKLAITEKDIDEKETYAELWMGTHERGPSLLKTPKDKLKTLSDILQKYPEYAGNQKIIDKFGTSLPFLFKILSVEQPLSIQTHPSKSLAKQLHLSHPEHYPDENHKPEMAIAVTKFGALLSFRTMEEIETNFKEITEFRNVVGEEIVNQYLNAEPQYKKEKLKSCFTSLMTASQAKVSENLSSLSKKWKSSNGELVEVFKIVNKYYPDDVGCFSIFFLNYVKLNPGQAIYLAADEAHCYLFGDCIECMACSDNVIRAGLTPKFKDIKMLCESLTYENKSVDEILLPVNVINDTVKRYDVKTEEFAVEEVNLQGKHNTLESKESASIVITLEGKATTDPDISVGFGYIGFIPAQTNVIFHEISEKLKLYRCYCPIK